MSEKNKYDFPYTQELSQPIEFGGTAIHALEYKALELGAVRRLGLSFGQYGDRMGWPQIVEMGFSMTGVAPARLEKLCGPDASIMREIVMAAWGEFHGIGNEEQPS